MIFALFWKDDHTHTSCHNSKDSEFISKAKKKKIIEKLATPLVCFLFQVDCHRADPELLQGSLVKKATVLQLTGGAWSKNQG